MPMKSPTRTTVLGIRRLVCLSWVLIAAVGTYYMYSTGQLVRGQQRIGYKAAQGSNGQVTEIDFDFDTLFVPRLRVTGYSRDLEYGAKVSDEILRMGLQEAVAADFPTKGEQCHILITFSNQVEDGLTRLAHSAAEMGWALYVFGPTIVNGSVFPAHADPFWSAINTYRHIKPRVYAAVAASIPANCIVWAVDAHDTLVTRASADAVSRYKKLSQLTGKSVFFSADREMWPFTQDAVWKEQFYEKHYNPDGRLANPDGGSTCTSRSGISAELVELLYYQTLGTEPGGQAANKSFLNSGVVVGTAREIKRMFFRILQVQYIVAELTQNGDCVDDQAMATWAFLTGEEDMGPDPRGRLDNGYDTRRKGNWTSLPACLPAAELLDHSYASTSVPNQWRAPRKTSCRAPSQTYASLDLEMHVSVSFFGMSFEEIRQLMTANGTNKHWTAGPPLVHGNGPYEYKQMVQKVSDAMFANRNTSVPPRKRSPLRIDGRRVMLQDLGSFRQEQEPPKASNQPQKQQGQQGQGGSTEWITWMTSLVRERMQDIGSTAEGQDEIKELERLIAALRIAFPEFGQGKRID